MKKKLLWIFAFALAQTNITLQIHGKVYEQHITEKKNPEFYQAWNNLYQAITNRCSELERGGLALSAEEITTPNVGTACENLSKVKLADALPEENNSYFFPHHPEALQPIATVENTSQGRAKDLLKELPGFFTWNRIANTLKTLEDNHCLTKKIIKEIFSVPPNFIITETSLEDNTPSKRVRLQAYIMPHSKQLKTLWHAEDWLLWGTGLPGQFRTGIKKIPVWACNLWSKGSQLTKDGLVYGASFVTKKNILRTVLFAVAIIILYELTLAPPTHHEMLWNCWEYTLTNIQQLMNNAPSLNELKNASLARFENLITQGKRLAPWSTSSHIPPPPTPPLPPALPMCPASLSQPLKLSYNPIEALLLNFDEAHRSMITKGLELFVQNKKALSLPAGITYGQFIQQFEAGLHEFGKYGFIACQNCTSVIP